MKTILALTFAMMSLPTFATTAVLCGNPAMVDDDNNKASVWIILDSETPASADEVSVTYRGKDAAVKSVHMRSGQIVIYTTKPESQVRVNLNDITYSNCEGDDRIFTIRHKPNINMSDMIVTQCRCFAG